MLPAQGALFNIQRDVCYLNAASRSPARGKRRASDRIGRHLLRYMSPLETSRLVADSPLVRALLDRVIT